MMLASGTTNGTICIWDITPAGVANECCLIRGHSIGVESVAFSPDGTKLASGGWDHRVKLWDLSRGESSIKELWFWEGTSQGGRPVAFSPDGKLLALGSFDGCLTVLNTANGNQFWATSTPRKPVNGVRFSPDGKLVALAIDHSKDTSGEVQIWDLFNRKLRATFGGWNGGCKSVAFSPDGSLLAATSSGGKARLYDVMLIKEKAILDGGWGAMGGLGFRPDGKLLATSESFGNVVFWDPATAQRRAILQQADNAQSPAIAFSPNGRVLAVGSADGSIELWDASEPPVAQY